MTHSASKRFWQHLAALPEPIQRLARKNYDLLKSDPKHPSLHFKKAGRFWSIRVGVSYRALGIEGDEGIVWFWIGTHAEYDRFVG